jgi:hypothetical protein
LTSTEFIGFLKKAFNADDAEEEELLGYLDAMIVEHKKAHEAA